MPGESSGFACRGPLEQSNSIRVGKVHFLDIATPFERAWSGNRLGERSCRVSYDWIETEFQENRSCFRIAVRALRMLFAARLATAARRRFEIKCRQKRV